VCIGKSDHSTLQGPHYLKEDMVIINSREVAGEKGIICE